MTPTRLDSPAARGFGEPIHAAWQFRTSAAVDQQMRRIRKELEDRVDSGGAGLAALCGMRRYFRSSMMPW
jgi:hypothetical protein